jgi:hypothetical protein
MAASKQNPPFATSDGKPTGQGKTSSGAVNLLVDPTGGGDKSGGRDFTKESRAQPAAKTQVGLPNSASIPAGGKGLEFADPKGVSKNASGTSEDKRPFKNLSSPSKGK